jgi:hypothetical protein
MIAVQSGLIIALLIFLAINILGYGSDQAYACSCTRLEPDRHYELSDVIFVGEVVAIDKNRPFEEGAYVTFDVSKSWKGVDAKSVTIHTGEANDPCSYYRFEESREYLVYGTEAIFAIDTRLCSGSIPTDSDHFVDANLEYLDSSYSPLQLKSGAITSFNPLPLTVIIGIPLAIGTAAFLILRKRGQH